jgi:hypothetical protein
MVLLYVLVVKRRMGRFPIFTSRVAYQILFTVVLYEVAKYGGKIEYARVYWLFAFGDYIFQVAVLYEMAEQLLKAGGQWSKWSTRRLIVSSFIALIAAAIPCLFISPPDRQGFDLWTIRSAIFTSILTCSLFVVMFRVATTRLRLGTHLMAIGQGMAVWALASLAEDAARLSIGWPQKIRFFDYFRILIYNGSLWLWIRAFWLPERQLQKPDDEQIQQLREAVIGKRDEQ